MRVLPARRQAEARLRVARVLAVIVILAPLLVPLMLVRPVASASVAVTTTYLNLRAGPRTDQRVRLVMPPGAQVEVIGGPRRGFYKVVYNGRPGWAHGDYLDFSGDDGGGGNGGTATVTGGALNLRAGPSTSDAVIIVMPTRATVEITGDPRNGFYPVTYRGQHGWAHGSYLSIGGSAPPSGSSGIVWPFVGGAWEIIQGYNGGTHQGQYYYALDLARTDGNTAGQPIYAPVSGTVLWNDSNSGGLAINMGNGFALAMFHVTFRSDLGRGDTVTQGEYLGNISGPGGNGYAVTPHVDMTLWDISGGSRVAAPYTGMNAISGVDLPDIGGWNQHGGKVVYP